MQVVPPGFAAIALEFRMTGDPEPWYVTFGVDAGEAGGDIGEIGQTCNSSWRANLQTLYSSSMYHTGCNVRLGQDDDETLTQFVAGSDPGNGNANGQMLPQNCALLVDKYSNRGGKKHRGRFFIPGILQEGNVDNIGSLEPSFRSLLNGAFEDFRVNLADGFTESPPCPMVILHSSQETPPLAPTPVVRLAVQGQISTQRRRLR